jgi:UDP-glucuronate decarboxylase
MTTIVVTGAAGFIGSHLVERLLSEGHRVIGVDNLFTGSKKNLKTALQNKAFTFIKHDIVKPFFIKTKVDQVYNLACPASPIHYQSNQVHTIKASTVGVINVLGFARQHQARVLQASTSEVYGDPEVHPQVEEYHGNVSTTGPRACYDEGKRCAETLFSDYHRMHGMEIKIARIFNTYGPRMSPHDGRVVSNFIVQALQNKPIALYGTGEQTRSFCYVSDLVDGLMRLMNSPAKVMGPINLGNPEERTVKELAERIIALTGSKSKLVYKKLPTDDPRRRQPDITKAKKILRFNPTVGIDQGLAETISYFKKIL